MKRILARTAWAAGLLAAFAGVAQPAEARVGMTLREFEATSGRPIDGYDAPSGGKGRVYRDVWVSEKSKKQFPGRTAIEMGNDKRVMKEVFLLDTALSNDETGALDAVGIAFNLLPTNTPRKFLDSGRRSYEKGWVLWFDYGEGRYLNFFLDQDEKRIEAIVAGTQDEKDKAKDKDELLLPRPEKSPPIETGDATGDATREI